MPHKCTVNVTFYTSISYSLTSINSHSVKGDTAVKVHSISIYTHRERERQYIYHSISQYTDTVYLSQRERELLWH